MDNCIGIDDASIQLIIKLQLEDLQSIADSSKGKQREGVIDDVDAAIATYKSELKSMQTTVSDRAMCQSIAHAVVADRDIIQKERNFEKQAARDREMALRMSTNPNAAANQIRTGQTQINKDDSELDDDIIEKFEALYVHCEEDNPTCAAESSSWAASRPAPKRSRPLVECVCCGDKQKFFNMVRCPCSHEYCRGCVESLFRASTTDESLFPPKCCKQIIPIEKIRPFIPSKLVGEFLAKKVEFETPNRTYCSIPTCSTFIPIQFIKHDVATCVRCATKTCVICKGNSHPGECPKDIGVQEVLRIARENGWQRCNSCRRVVQLSHGCNHITCPCGAQFCYVCGVLWKQCRCPQWEEDRLYERAAAIVDRAPRVDARRRVGLVEAQRRNLMQNHECQHQSWRYRQGAAQCEGCHDHLPGYLFECRQCHTLACRRCRYNRL